MKLYISIALILVLAGGFLFAQVNNEPITITGNITEVNHPIAKFKSDDGTIYEIHMGPYWYWLNNGYKLNNETAVVKGEVKSVNGVNELFPVEITQNGNSIKLTDKDGIPLWAGQKNNNGKGYGWKNGRGNCGNCPNCPGYGRQNRQDNNDNNGSPRNGRGWRQNCSNRTK